jgi:hypothetical protein
MLFPKQYIACDISVQSDLAIVVITKSIDMHCDRKLI